MPYYPKNRIETNLYTRGREFSVTITGEEYIGYYYKLYNGTFFTGKTPNDTPTQELIPLVSQPIEESPIIVTLNQSEDKNLEKYVSLLKNTPEDKKLPIPYYPKPTKENYELGEIQRYFAKKINEAIFIEIGQKDFNNLIEENNAYLWQYYVTFSIPWEISGRKNEVENINKKEYEIKLGEQKMIEREKILLKEYGTIGSIVYFVKVKTFENGTYIIKIGESRKGITGRYNEHKSKHEECLLLDCFAVNNSKGFETFLHEHDNIRLNKVTDLPGHETELELFLIGKKLSYQTLLQIANHNYKYFNDNDNYKLELENDKLKMMLELKQNDNGNVLINELIQQVKHLSSKMDNLEKSNKEILEKFNSSQTKTTTNFNQPLVTLGPRLQQINPETMLLNKVYESIAECIKETNFKMKRPSIIKAINENTIYNGYRWAFVDRTGDPNIIANIAETKQTKIQNTGYIAKLNKEKTEILNVYLDRKTAAKCNGYQSISALDTPVKKFSLTNGHYYILYNDCTLQSSFISKYGSPLLYKDGIGQFNQDGQLVKEFVCKYDCIKQLTMSDKTLAKALDKNIAYNGSYFKSIGAKVSAI